jgi:rhodanese-related sulfurtransferase
MKRLILAAMLSTTVFAQQVPAVQSAAPIESKAKKLTRAEFDTLLQHPAQLLLIDVRRPDEISAIGGFPVYLNIQAADLKNHLNEITNDKVIVTVSNHATRAGIAADLLSSHNFKVAGAIGVQTYEAEGGAVQKFPGPQHPPQTGAAQ